MREIINVPMFLTILSILTVVTNITVEVLKKLTFNVIPTQFLAVAVAIVLTWAAYVWYAMEHTIRTQPIYYVAVTVVGIMVSYAAMFGFDTLKSALSKAIGGDSDGKD